MLTNVHRTLFKKLKEESFAKKVVYL